MNTSARFWDVVSGWAVIGLPIVVFVVWANITNPRQFVSTFAERRGRSRRSTSWWRAVSPWSSA